MENGEEPDPDAGISVAYDLLQQNIEKSKAMADADDDLRYVGSSKESWMLDPKFKPKKLSRFLWGGLFTVVTDLEHLHGLFQKQEFATKRQEKMVLSMLEFDFTLGYKPGKLMIFPDAVSQVQPQIPSY